MNKSTEKPWTDLEKGQLAYLFEDGLTDLQISERLGRTPTAVKKKRRAAGLLRRLSRPWGEEESQKVHHWWSIGWSDVAIAKELGRTWQSVKSRRHACGWENRPGEYTEKVHVFVTAEMRRDIDSVMSQTGCSLSEVLRVLLTDGLAGWR